MTARLASLSLLIVLLAFAGCRDALVDEPLIAPPEPEENTGVRSAYLKGPDTITLGQISEYRAEPIREATRYAWEIGDSSTGRVSGRLQVDNEGRDRRLFAEATRSGYVVLRVSVFDDNTLIGVGTKTVLVSP